MSYASVASHNSQYNRPLPRLTSQADEILVPEGEMPQPDQDLLDGHFEGEHEASTDIDHKVGTLTIIIANQHESEANIGHRSTSSRPVPILSTHPFHTSLSITPNQSLSTTTTYPSHTH